MMISSENNSIRFPVLLTVAEADTLHGQYDRTVFDGGYPRDLYRGTYVQGSTVQEDSLETKLARISCSPHHEDCGLAATKSGYVYCAKDRYFMVDSGHKPTSLPIVPEGQVRVSQDGKSLLDQWQPDPKSERRVLRATDLASGQSSNLFDDAEVSVSSFDLLGEDKALVAACGSPETPANPGTQFVEVDLRSGQRTIVRTEPSLEVMEMCISPDGKRVAFTDQQDCRVEVLELSTGKRFPISEPQFERNEEEEDEVGDGLYYGAWRSNLHFSPDGSRVLYSRGNTVLEGNDFTTYSSLYAGSVDGGELAKVAGSRWDDFYIHDACPLNVACADKKAA